MIVGHIGVRKNSKGLKGKNFRPINGKPLLDWSLDQLLRCEALDFVFVSTDCDLMYRHSIDKGALDIGLRPDSLADDRTAKWDVWKHSTAMIEEQVGKVDLLVDLDCTSPLRLDEDIIGALDTFHSQKPDMVMSCCHAKKNPYFNLLELDKSGCLHVSKSGGTKIVARQLAPLVLEHAASTYVIDSSYLKRAKSLYEGKVIPFMMPEERCIDIDSELDYEIVEFLMQKRGLLP